MPRREPVPVRKRLFFRSPFRFEDIVAGAGQTPPEVERRKPLFNRVFDNRPIQELARVGGTREPQDIGMQVENRPSLVDENPASGYSPSRIIRDRKLERIPEAFRHPPQIILRVVWRPEFVHASGDRFVGIVQNSTKRKNK